MIWMQAYHSSRERQPGRRIIHSKDAIGLYIEGSGEFVYQVRCSFVKENLSIAPAEYSGKT
ncbi:MAG TPA: hypothetical protein PKL26_05160, partial [Methanolinea sp.]|nr:hypothetical protein [Methanolinea sp.]